MKIIKIYNHAIHTHTYLLTYTIHVYTLNEWMKSIRKRITYIYKYTLKK